jgi:hypothetical protein
MQAAELLKANGIEPSEKMRSYTVHSIVHELLQFYLCKASDFAARQLVGSFADKVVRLLNDCGAPLLDAVVGNAIPDVTVNSASVPTLVNAVVPTMAASTGGTRQLKSLTVEELGRALTSVGFATLVPTFAEKEVTGKLLANCEEVADLMTEDFGVASKAKARTLLEQVEEWRAQGVGGLV